MSSESNIWTPDADADTAALEEALTTLGSGWLMRVHLDTLRALELPAPTLEQVRTAYNAFSVAKAGEAWYSSQKTLERLRAFGKAITPPELFIDLAETVTKKWLEEGRLKTRAARQAVSAYLVGLLKGGRAPATLETPTDKDALALEYARANAGENITALCDRTRHALSTTLITAQANGTTPAALSGQLLEKFAALNRDWRRIAISSVSENRSNGELAAAPIGSPMRWSAANDACKHCRYHHGKTYTLTTAEEVTDGSSQIWVGKSYPPKNLGPQAWPVIPQHANCRCRWVRADRTPAPDAGVEAMIQRALQQAREF